MFFKDKKLILKDVVTPLRWDAHTTPAIQDLVQISKLMMTYMH